MIKKKEKNTFIICGKGFFKTKPDRIAIEYISFKKLTRGVIWLPITYLLFKYL